MFVRISNGPAAGGVSTTTSTTREGSMHARLFRLMGAGLLALPVIAAHTSWGGWATITLRELPDYLVARQPTQLTFTVRQHGVHLLGGLSPTVEATSGKQRVNAAATPGATEGQYTATLTPIEPGEWTITIHSGSGKTARRCCRSRRSRWVLPRHVRSPMSSAGGTCSWRRGASAVTCTASAPTSRASTLRPTS